MIDFALARDRPREALGSGVQKTVLLERCAKNYGPKTIFEQRYQPFLQTKIERSQMDVKSHTFGAVDFIFLVFEWFFTCTSKGNNATFPN